MNINEFKPTKKWVRYALTSFKAPGGMRVTKEWVRMGFERPHDHILQGSWFVNGVPTLVMLLQEGKIVHLGVTDRMVAKLALWRKEKEGVWDGTHCAINQDGTREELEERKVRWKERLGKVGRAEKIREIEARLRAEMKERREGKMREAKEKLERTEAEEKERIRKAFEKGDIPFAPGHEN